MPRDTSHPPGERQNPSGHPRRRRSDGSGLSATVLLATSSRTQLLARVLAPLRNDPAASEMIVVVDGCRDGSVELLASMGRQDERIRTIFVRGGGATRALLTGALQARGDLLVILEDDVVVADGSVAGHIRHHRGADGLLVVGYVEIDPQPARRPRDLRRSLRARRYERDVARYRADPPSILANLRGGYLSIRRADYLRATSGHAGGPADLAVGYRDLGASCLAHGLRAVFDLSLSATRLHDGAVPPQPSGATGGPDRILGPATSFAPRSAARGRIQ
jgi:hypothetical protein